MSDAQHIDHLIVSADGGARGNPGPAAAGFIIKDSRGEVLENGGLYLGETTNNQAEYQAVFLALDKAKRYKPQQIDLRLDSELIVKQLSGEYRVKHAGLKPFYEQVQRLIEELGDVRIKHVPRAENKEADRQVNLVLDRMG